MINVGYTVAMFAILLITAAVIITAANYGIAKDSQIAPLKAENIYADRETGKAQTGLTIINTCLEGNNLPYVGAGTGDGPYILWLIVKNNGSMVLNPNNSTILYNSSYYNFNVTSGVGNSSLFGNVWSPLINSTIKVPNIYITSQNYKYPFRLMLAASNGITAIAPTAPSNFFGKAISDNSSYAFSWTPPTSNSGIAYYILYELPNNPVGSCDQNNNPTGLTNISFIAGNVSTDEYPSPCPSPPCKAKSFYMTAVDNLGNMGIQSVTINCNPPTSGQNCTNKM